MYPRTMRSAIAWAQVEGSWSEYDLRDVNRKTAIDNCDSDAPLVFSMRFSSLDTPAL